MVKRRKAIYSTTIKKRKTGAVIARGSGLTASGVKKFKKLWVTKTRVAKTKRIN